MTVKNQIENKPVEEPLTEELSWRNKARLMASELESALPASHPRIRERLVAEGLAKADDGSVSRLDWSATSRPSVQDSAEDLIKAPYGDTRSPLVWTYSYKDMAPDSDDDSVRNRNIDDPHDHSEREGGWQSIMKGALGMEERDAEDERRERAYPMGYVRQSEGLTMRHRHKDWYRRRDWSDDLSNY